MPAFYWCLMSNPRSRQSHWNWPLYHACMSACIHACMHVWMCVYMHVCMSACTYGWICARVCRCVHVGYACTYACRYNCTYVSNPMYHVYLYIVSIIVYMPVWHWVHIFILACMWNNFIRMYASCMHCMYVYMCVYMYECMHVCIYIYIYIYVCIYVRVYVYMYVCLNTIATTLHVCMRSVSCFTNLTFCDYSQNVYPTLA